MRGRGRGRSPAQHYKNSGSPQGGAPPPIYFFHPPPASTPPAWGLPHPTHFLLPPRTPGVRCVVDPDVGLAVLGEVRLKTLPSRCRYRVVHQLGTRNKRSGWRQREGEGRGSAWESDLKNNPTLCSIPGTVQTSRCPELPAPRQQLPLEVVHRPPPPCLYGGEGQ